VDGETCHRGGTGVRPEWATGHCDGPWAGLVGPWREDPGITALSGSGGQPVLTSAEFLAHLSVAEVPVVEDDEGRGRGMLAAGGQGIREADCGD
jgi:hypothetical protein